MQNCKKWFVMMLCTSVLLININSSKNDMNEYFKQAKETIFQCEYQQHKRIQNWSEICRSICWPAIWWCIDQDWPNLETEISTQLQSDPNHHIALWVKSGDKRNLKCLKVNDNFALIFHWKIFISFLSDAKLPKVYDRFLGLIIYVKYLRSYLQKT